MPYALKRPHPTRDGVKVYHTWDPDGDGYEEIRKFPTEALAQEFADTFSHSGIEVVEIGYEIGQDDAEIQEKYDDSINSNSVRGSIHRASNGVDYEPEVVNYWSAHGLLED